MPRYRTPPLTLTDIWRDGPPVRLRDLAAITGIAARTVERDIKAGYLVAHRRNTQPKAPYLVHRDVARVWLQQMGFSQAS